MKITVLSKQQAEQFSYATNTDCVIVSIVDLLDAENIRPVFAVNDSIKDILYLQFDDVEDGPGVMTDDDAAKIADFVIKWKDKVSEIVVHCMAGISRSVGTAAAIGLALNDDDSFIFKNPRYCPNRHCYRYMINAFLDRGYFSND